MGEAKENLKKVTIGNLYLFMGRDLEKIDYMSAGGLVGIAGLEEHLLSYGKGRLFCANAYPISFQCFSALVTPFSFFRIHKQC